MERFLKVVMLVPSAWLILNHAATSAWGSSECQERCGDIIIPLPFGIKQGCYRSLGFRLICNDSTGSKPKLFLAHNDEAAWTLEVMAFSLNVAQVRVQYYPVAFMDASTTVSSFPWRALENSPFAFSYGGSFVAAGCDVTAYLMYFNITVIASCTATCNSKHDITPFMNNNYNSCPGIFCCKVDFLSDFKPFEICSKKMKKTFEIRLVRPNRTETRNNTAIWAFIGDPYAENIPIISINAAEDLPPVTATLDWTINDNQTCKEARLQKNSYACGPNTECIEDSTTLEVYNCICTGNYQGNPYEKRLGCQERYPVKKATIVIGVIIGVSTASTLVLLTISIYFLRKRWKERTARRIKEKHFRKNRGLFLQQLISSNRDLAERTKIFSLEELERATNHFHATRILGHGGHGTVYKGILSDQRVAAIKKAKIAKQKEIDEFINEVVILSQINHKNVVRLFGCCLESEVPLLVYEFVPNGTLNEHLERHSSLSWEDRLRIATEASGALAYLHSSTSISIFHRDVKSSNILLDHNCTAKVADFGASRTLPLDQTHVTTLVQGTFGYLDPEYYQTSQLTEKSDVYSFGVILVELLTGEKPISSARCPDEINLGSRFLLARQGKRFFQLLEARVKEEGSEEELGTIAMLAEKCLQLRGGERPTMKEVEAILEGLRRSKNQKRHTTNEQHYEQHYEVSDDTQNEPSNSHHYEVVQANSEGSSRIFSLEKEFISSLDWPR